MHALTHPHPTALSTHRIALHHEAAPTHPSVRYDTDLEANTQAEKAQGLPSPGGGWAGRQGPEPAANPPRLQRARSGFHKNYLIYLKKYPCRYFHTSSTHIGPRGKQPPHVLLCSLFPTLPMPIWFSPRIMQSEKRRSHARKNVEMPPSS